MENELVSGLILVLTIVLELIVLDRACLKKDKNVVIVKDKRIKCGTMDNGWSPGFYYEDSIIDFELNGKEYSAFVSSKFYKTIEKGTTVCLEYGKSRLIRSMVFEVLEN